MSNPHFIFKKLVVVFQLFLIFNVGITLTPIADARPPLGLPDELWITSSTGDTIYASQEVELQFYMANSFEILGIYHSFVIYSPDGAEWEWLSQPDGYGSPDSIMTLVPGSRFEEVPWVLVVETIPQPMGGGPGEDTIGVGAIAFDPNMMESGPLEHMWSWYLRPTKVGTICIDSTCIPPCSFHQWHWDPGGVFPPWPEPICFTVLPSPVKGDINCDGDANVGDAVYLINWIFKGGPEPCK
jgi:hypothetical protein